MSNIFGGTNWIIDTTGVICTYPVYVKSIKVIAEGAVGGENLLIHDAATGKLLWEALATVGNYSSSDIVEACWINGFTVNSLGGIAGAKLLIDLG